MKKKIISIFLLIIVLSIFPVTAFGTDNGDTISYVTTNTNRTSGRVYTLTMTCPAEISAGDTVTFHLSATGSDNVKYRIYGLSTWDGTEWVSVYDVASFSGTSAYTTNPDWTFTFSAAGTYAIRFSVMDMNQYDDYPYYYTFNSDTTQLADGTWVPGYALNVTGTTVEEKADAVAAQCLSEVGENANDYAKALWLNDWLVENVTYDNSYTYSSAEGALLRGTGTCEAYHRAYVMLLERVGIETGRVEGYHHVWTAAKLDGAWYQIDTTWNDGGDAAYDGIDLHRLYFGLTDELISMDAGGTHAHTPVAGCESNSLEENYFIYSGEIKKFSDEYAVKIQSAIDAGSTTVSLPISKSSWPDNYKNVIFNLVAYQLTNKENFSSPVTVTYSNDVLSAAVQKNQAKESFIAASDIYFGRTSSSEPTDCSSVDLSKLSSYKKSVFTEGNGILFEGATLLVDNGNVRLRYIFCFTDDSDSDCSIKLNGNDLETVTKQGMYIYVDTPLIKDPKGFEEIYTLSVQNDKDSLTVKECVLGYAYDVFKANDNPALINLMKAMVHYWAVAEES